MSIIPNFIIVGDKGIGKSQFIRQIITHQVVCKPFTKFKETQIIRINNKLYGKNSYKCLFQKYKNDLKEGIIFVNTEKTNSLKSIPFWYEKIRQQTPNIRVRIILYNNNKSQDNLQYMHKIIDFCSQKNIKICVI